MEIRPEALPRELRKLERKKKKPRHEIFDMQDEAEEKCNQRMCDVRARQDDDKRRTGTPERTD